MTDAIDCPDCGVNADTCRCVPPYPHTSAMLRERDKTAEWAQLGWTAEWMNRGEPTGLAAWWVAGGALMRWLRVTYPVPDTAFTLDAAGRLCLRTP